MGYARAKRGALFIAREATFGGGGTPVYVKTKEVTMPSGMTYRAGDDIVQQDAEDVGSVLFEPGDATIRMGLHPGAAVWPTKAPSLEDEPPIGLLLSGILGQTMVGGYGVTGDGSSATVLQLDLYGAPPSELGFGPGQPVYVRTSGATSILGASAIKKIDDEAMTLTLRAPLPSAPGAGASVMGGFFWPKLPAPVAPSLAASWRGEAESLVQSAVGGCISQATISAKPRELAELAVTLRFARPIPMALGETGGAPAPQDYAYPESPQVIGGGLYLYDGATTLKIDGGLEIDFGIDLAELAGIAGVDPNGISGYLHAARTIRVKLHPSYVNNSLIDYFQSGRVLTMTAWWGQGAAVWMVQIPAAIIVSPPTPAPDDKIIRMPVELGCATYTGDDGEADDDDPGDKPFVIGTLA